MESLDHFMFSFTCCLLLLRCGGVSQAAEFRLLLESSGPLGYEKPFYMPDASLLLTRGDMNFSDGFQLGSFCGTSDHIFNLYFCCWRCKMETFIFMISPLAYADLWGRGFALWRCLQRIGCDFCKEGLSVCSSVTACIAQGLPRCLKDIIALSANTEKLSLP